MKNEVAPPLRVLILGGGFGGAYVARKLARRARAGEVAVTLVSLAPSFVFTPLLHEVATGGLSARSAAVPLRQAFPEGAVRVLVGQATAVDAGSQLATVRCAEGSEMHVAYDVLVVALGSRATFRGVPGAEECAMPLKSLDDARRIRAAIIAAHERAARERRAPSFAVVGGGPTGVELAAEVAELCRGTLARAYPETFDARVALLSADDELLPMLRPSGRQIALAALEGHGVDVTLAARVASVDAEGVALEDGLRVPADAVLWAAGVEPAPFPEGIGLVLDERGRAQVDASLRAVGHPEIYVLGDQAAGAPMLAQAATQQAVAVAASIVAGLRGRAPRPFRFRPQGLLVSLGHWRAVGQIGPVTVSGPLTWFLWRTVYLVKFPSFRKRLRVAAEWTLGLFFPRDIAA